MKLLPRILCILIPIFLGMNAKAKTDEYFATSKTCDSLIKLAKYNHSISSNPELGDSLAFYAVNIAMASGNKPLTKQIIIEYAKNSHNIENQRMVHSYINNILDNDQIEDNERQILELKLADAYLLLQTQNFNESLEELIELSLKLEKDDQLTIECNLVFGALYVQMNKKIKAYESFLEAVYLAKSSKNDSLLLESYSQLTHFFLQNGNAQKSKEFNNLSYDLLQKSNEFSEYKKIINEMDRADIYLSFCEFDAGILLAKKVIERSKQINFLFAKDFMLGTIRRTCIDNKRIDVLKLIYIKYFPEEFEALKSESMLNYYRVKALFLESENNIDSAKYFLQLADTIIEHSNNIPLQSNFYKRLGEFYLRQNQTSNAIPQFEKALSTALEISYYPYILENSQILDSLYASQDDILKAYYFNKLNQKYVDSNQSVLQSDKMVTLEIENMERLKELQERNQEIEDAQKFNLQMIITAMGVVFALIILVLLSSFSIPIWVVRLFGYLTFIFFFEFIIFIADTYVHYRLHGDVIKIMIFKIIFIAILLPIHHKTEEKIVHYLMQHKLLSHSVFNFKKIKEFATNQLARLEKLVKSD